MRALHQQSDGWAAGVTLMLERLKRAGGGGGTLSGDTHESVFNYFASLIFDQASDTARHTLLGLAFAPRVTPSLAQALSGNADAGKLLESLHRRHLFTDRRPGPEPVYQFHALFQAFLRAKAAGADPRPAFLRERTAPDGPGARESGEWEAGFELLVQSESWEQAAALGRGARVAVALDRAVANTVAMDRFAAGDRGARAVARALARMCPGADRSDDRDRDLRTSASAASPSERSVRAGY